jgi:DNA ligase-1
MGKAQKAYKEGGMVKFNDITQILDTIQKTQGTLAKQAALEGFFQECTADDVEFIAVVNWLMGQPFAPIQDVKLGCGPSTVRDALLGLVDYKQERLEALYKEKGHWGLVAQELKAAPRKSVWPVTCQEFTVDEVLKGLLKISHQSRPLDKIREIQQLLYWCQPSDAKYLISLLVGQMPPGTGVGEGLVLDALAGAFQVDRKLAQQKFALCGNLGQVASACRIAGQDGLQCIQIQPFHPVLPMLAYSGNYNLAQAAACIPEGHCSAEFKYDGIRIQGHKVGNTVKLFTRNLNEVTQQYPEIVQGIQMAFAQEDVILDGEVVAINSQGRVVPFQNTSTRTMRKEGIQEQAQAVPCQYKVFDLLWHHGESLMEMHQVSRRATLEQLIMPNGQVQLAARFFDTATVFRAEIQDFMARAIGDGNEGIILKNIYSPYEADYRGKNWVKVKQMLDSLGLAITAAEYGSGKNAGLFTSFEISCLGPDGAYYSLGRVGQGFSDKQKKLLTEKLKPLVCLEQGLLCQVQPRIILEVACEEIQKSSSNSSGFGLRFPKLASIRADLDKPDTLAKVQQLYGGQARHS